jgi:putative endonuclease
MRLQKHKTNHKGWTGRDKEWQIVYYEKYASLTEALKREKQVKSWKNRKRTETLIGNSTDYRVRLEESGRSQVRILPPVQRCS